MPSFDIVCEADMQMVDNAVQSVKREVENRYDFKGSKSSIDREDTTITILADDDYKLKSLQDMLKTHATRQKLDAKVFVFQNPEKASGNMLRQKVDIQQGIDKDNAKKIVKHVKDIKLKVQASIRGEEVRIEGKKRDDLQQAIQAIKEMNLSLPLSYINFRD